MDDDEEDDEEEEEEDEDEDMAEVRIALIFFLDASSWPASHASAYVGLGTDFYARLTRLARTGGRLRGDRPLGDHHQLPPHARCPR